MASAGGFSMFRHPTECEANGATFKVAGLELSPVVVLSMRNRKSPGIRFVESAMDTINWRLAGAKSGFLSAAGTGRSPIYWKLCCIVRKFQDRLKWTCLAP